VRTRKNSRQGISEVLRTNLALTLLLDVASCCSQSTFIKVDRASVLVISISELQALASALIPLEQLPTCASRSEETKNSHGTSPQKQFVPSGRSLDIVKSREQRVRDRPARTEIKKHLHSLVRLLEQA
jgi:hypothetical protein